MCSNSEPRSLLRRLVNSDRVVVPFKPNENLPAECRYKRAKSYGPGSALSIFLKELPKKDIFEYRDARGMMVCIRVQNKVGCFLANTHVTHGSIASSYLTPKEIRLSPTEAS